MKKNVYLDKKISDLDDNIRTLKKGRFTNILVVALIVLGLTVPAIALADILAFYSGTAMLGVWDALAILYGYGAVKDKNQDIRQFENEKEHLKKIKEKGIKSTKKLDARRLERIYELTKKQEEYIPKDSINSVVLGAGVFASIISSIALIVMNVAGVGVGLGLLASILSARNIIKNGEDVTKLEARIDNLKNDIELGSICGYNPKSATVVNGEKKELSKGGIARAIAYSPMQEQQVDQYISELEKVFSDTGKGKVLTKKMEENL